MRKLATILFFGSLLFIISCGAHKIVVRPETIKTSRIYNWEYCGIQVQAISPYPEPGITSLPMGIRITNTDGVTSPRVLMYGELDGLIILPPLLSLDVPSDVHHPYVGEWFPRYEQWLWFEVQRPGPNYCFFKVFLKTR